MGWELRRFWLVTAPLALILLSLSPLPAEASHTSLNCTVTLDWIFSPGLSATPSKGTFAGQAPGMECTGIMQGHEVTGLGSLAIQGNYGQSTTAGDTCQLEAGTGEYSLTLPTRGGTVKETGSLAEILGPAGRGTLGATSNQTGWSGTFVFSPKEGDCVFTPITLAQATLQLEGKHGD